MAVAEIVRPRPRLTMSRRKPAFQGPAQAGPVSIFTMLQAHLAEDILGRAAPPTLETNEGSAAGGPKKPETESGIAPDSGCLDEPADDPTWLEEQ